MVISPHSEVRGYLDKGGAWSPLQNSNNTAMQGATGVRQCVPPHARSMGSLNQERTYDDYAEVVF